MRCETCGKEFNREKYKTNQAMLGAFNLHSYHCKVKGLLQKNKNVSRETMEEVTIVPGDECTHNFRFLNKSKQDEAIALNNGFTGVCVKCQILQ